MKIGEYNKLTVNRRVDFGLYLIDNGDATEVLLPARYVTAQMKEGDELEVFVYRDSDDRPVAVTTRPYATVGEFAFLEVVAVNKVGAFLDWGLPKDLLVPFSEQKMRMREGGIYPVYVYLDHTTGRVAATAKIEKYLDNAFPDYRPGQMVDVLIYHRKDRGYTCIVDNKHSGMLYDNELFRSVEIGQSVKASVHRVREDGKIDLTLGGNARLRTNSTADEIMAMLKDKCVLPVNEKSSPEEIRLAFGCSKKDFKKAVGHLLKEGKIDINATGEIVYRGK